MLAIPQTNLQLYRRLSELGRAPQLTPVRRGYELAASLFAGVYRASGKPFVAHLVGTAGVLVEDGAPPEIVAAGLLHAAYVQGTFGDGPPGPTVTHRRQVAAAIGEDAERLVARYTTMPWKAGNLSAERRRPDSLDPLDRDVLRMRLANEVEELFDFAVLHHRDGEIRRADALAALPVWIEWARAISADWIAAALESLPEPLAAFRPDEALRTDRVKSYRALPPLRPTIAGRGRETVAALRRAARRLRERARPLL